jgi:DNA-binding CsgD family transcriptional regulator
VLDVLVRHLRQFRLNALCRRRTSTTSLPGAWALTVRKREVLELVADGRTNVEISRLLWISPGTVRKHLESVYDKPGVHARTGAVAAAKWRRASEQR